MRLRRAAKSAAEALIWDHVPMMSVRCPRRAAWIALHVALLVGAAVAAHSTLGDGAAPVSAAEQPLATTAVATTAALDVAIRDQPVASRSAARTIGPHAVPAPTTKDAACRLDLGYGVWAIDTTAARTLTMLTAVAYRDGRSYVKAARAFERQLEIEGRTPLSPTRAKDEITRKRKYAVPRTSSLDAVYAMFRPQALTCAQPLRTMPVQAMLTNGLTPRTVSMVRGWEAAYGGRPLGGFAPGGVDSGHIENSAHYDGRALDVFFSLDDADNAARGWLLAHWLIAHADYHQISTIIFSDTVWTRLKSAEGWRPYVHPYGVTENVTLRHLDHIHVDVVHGVPADPAPADPAPAS